MIPLTGNTNPANKTNTNKTIELENEMKKANETNPITGTIEHKNELKKKARAAKLFNRATKGRNRLRTNADGYRRTTPFVMMIR